MYSIKKVAMGKVSLAFEKVTNCTGTLFMENITSAIANIMTMQNFVIWEDYSCCQLNLH